MVRVADLLPETASKSSQLALDITHKIFHEHARLTDPRHAISDPITDCRRDLYRNILLPTRKGRGGWAIFAPTATLLMAHFVNHIYIYDLKDCS